MHLLAQCRNVSRIAYLELLWGLRIPESMVYNFVAPALSLVLLGLIRGSKEYLAILVPGLVALTTASSALHGMGAKMSFMRAYGSWRTLQASPIPAGLYFAGLLGSRMVRIVLVVAIMLLVAAWWLGFHLQGNPLLLLAYVLLGTFTFAALGMLVASLVSSPQAVSGVMNLTLLVMVFTSDVLYVSEVPWVDAISRVFPLVYLVDLVRSHLLGRGFPEHGLLDVAALIAWAVLCSWAAMAIARRRVEER